MGGLGVFPVWLPLVLAWANLLDAQGDSLSQVAAGQEVIAETLESAEEVLELRIGDDGLWVKAVAGSGSLSCHRQSCTIGFIMGLEFSLLGHTAQVTLQVMGHYALVPVA